MHLIMEDAKKHNTQSNIESHDLTFDQSFF